MSVPSAVIYFTAYEELRYFIKDIFYKSEAHPPVWVSMVSGATARACTGTIVNPLELIKTKLQSANISHSGNVVFISVSCSLVQFYISRQLNLIQVDTKI